MATVTAPTIAALAAFDGDLEFTKLTHTGLAVRARAGFEGALVFDTSGVETDWRAVLVDAAGATIAQAPDATIGTITQRLSDTDSWQVTIPVGGTAGQAMLAETVPPEIEVQVWRGERCVAWGPVVDPDVDLAAGTVTLRCQGAKHHLDRTLVGPPALPNQLTNPDFVEGLDGWGRLHTDLIPFGDGQIGTFLNPDGYFTHYPVGATGDGVPTPPRSDVGMVLFHGNDTSEDGGLQLYQDYAVSASPHGTIRVTVRAAWWIDALTAYAETNLRLAAIVTAHPRTQQLPIGYYVPSMVAVARWDDDGPIPRNQWHDREATLEIPPYSGDWIVHCALHAPLCEAWATLAEVTIDNPLAVDRFSTAMVEDLLDHAQDTAYGHVDRNLGLTAGTGGGPMIDHDLHEGDHVPVGQLIDGLAREGRIEWRPRYAPGATPGRTIHAGRPPLGTKHRRHRVTITDDAPTGTIAAVKGPTRRWSSGSTVVTAQTSRGRTRAEVAESTGTLGWEETFVAPDYVPRWRLRDWARRTLDEASNPFVVEVTSTAGSAWVDGTIQVGDLLDATIDRDGVAYSGVVRIQELAFDPTNDTATATLVPYVEPPT